VTLVISAIVLVSCSLDLMRDSVAFSYADKDVRQPGMLPFSIILTLARAVQGLAAQVRLVLGRVDTVDRRVSGHRTGENSDAYASFAALVEVSVAGGAWGVATAIEGAPVWLRTNEHVAHRPSTSATSFLTGSWCFWRMLSRSAATELATSRIWAAIVVLDEMSGSSFFEMSLLRSRRAFCTSRLFFSHWAPPFWKRGLSQQAERGEPEKALVLREFCPSQACFSGHQ
jgi:hypothetical protein